ncbi:hypothetical protein [Paenibacillus sp. FSL K6-1230]|uniref:hypothetical protein n=1 Tax=Paenibacillus sp. FSL K6-1230 TaxID=2921603 RepID=UPI0030F8E97E
MDIGEIKQYIIDIQRYRDTAASFTDDSPGALIRKIELFTKALMLIGRVSSWMDGEYKRKYAARKQAYAMAKVAAPKGEKETKPELDIIKHREEETTAFERKQLWRNEFESLKEHIHELRLRLRVDMHIGDGGE